MADVRESFPGLENASGVGVAATATQAGDASTGKEGSTVFAFRDENGNEIQPQLGQADLDGSVPVADAIEQTYSASITFTAATTPTDIFTIYGSGTKTIFIADITFDGSTTSGSGILDTLLLVKRSAVNTGGTFVSETIVPLDSNNAAATATVGHYTANPSGLGAAVGNIKTERISFANTGLTSGAVEWDWNNGNTQQPVLRGTTQGLAINLSSTSITGNVITISIEWYEV